MVEPTPSFTGKVITPEGLTTLVVAALALEVHEMEQGDLTEARMSRAEHYLALLRKHST